MLVNGKVAVISGSSRGIGRATALLLAQKGAHIAINYLNNREEAEKVEAKVNELGREAIIFQGNVSHTDSANA